MGNPLLDNAEDIELIRPATDKERWVFAAKPDAAFKKQYFNVTTSNPAESNLGAFNGHWKRNSVTGEISGSSTFLGLRFDKAIRSLGLWIPGVLEARVLDTKKKLSNDVYRDNGLALFNDGQYNVEIAQALMKRARKEGWKTPILVSFRDLDYQVNPQAQYGVNVSFVQNPKELVTGEKAREALRGFRWVGDSGALWLCRYCYGAWYAYGGNLANSDGLGRVGDWICGEAARTDLVKAYAGLDEGQGGAQIRELEKARELKREAFNAELGVN